MIRYYGEKLPGKQPTESAEMKTFFNIIRRDYPEIGAVAVHIRNEGQRNIRQTQSQKAEGMVKGAADIMIPGAPAFVCEMKSQGKGARVSPEQTAYLEAAAGLGAFCCVAYGHGAALDALREWMDARAR